MKTIFGYQPDDYKETFQKYIDAAKIMKTRIIVYGIWVSFWIFLFGYQIHKKVTTEPIMDYVVVDEKRNGGQEQTSGKTSVWKNGTWIKLRHVNDNNRIEFLFIENPFVVDTWKKNEVYLKNEYDILNQWNAGTFFLAGLIFVFISFVVVGVTESWE